MDGDGWVRDPDAIDTIIALGELRVGDHVIVKNCDNVAVPKEHDGCVFVVQHVPPDVIPRTHPWWPNGHEADEEPESRFVVFRSDWVFVRDNIAAWRRP